MRSQNPSCCLARWQPVRFVPAARYVNKRKLIEEENPLSSFANIANFHQSTKFFAINRFQNMPTSRHTYPARWYQAGVFGRELRGNSLCGYQAGVFGRELRGNSLAWYQAGVFGRDLRGNSLCGGQAGVFGRELRGKSLCGYQAGVFGRDLRGNSLAWYQAGVFGRDLRGNSLAWYHA